MTKFLNYYLLIIVLFVLLLPAMPVHAASLLDSTFKCTGISEGSQKVDPKDQVCTLNDFIRIAVNLSKIILGLTGSLALLAFVYGGFVFLLSGGSAQNVEKGKGILKAAVIGLVIVFASYAIIKFVMNTAGLDWQGDTNYPAPIQKKN